MASGTPGTNVTRRRAKPQLVSPCGRQLPLPTGTAAAVSSPRAQHSHVQGFSADVLLFMAVLQQHLPIMAQHLASLSEHWLGGLQTGVMTAGGSRCTIRTSGLGTCCCCLAAPQAHRHAQRACGGPPVTHLLWRGQCTIQQPAASCALLEASAVRAACQPRHPSRGIQWFTRCILLFLLVSAEMNCPSANRPSYRQLLLSP
jgi:hypothetical protein